MGGVNMMSSVLKILVELSAFTGSAPAHVPKTLHIRIKHRCTANLVSSFLYVIFTVLNVNSFILFRLLYGKSLRH
jgi:hypothetical protein